MKFLISWTSMNGGSMSGGSDYVTDWNSVLRLLESLRTNPGTMCLENVDSPAISPISVDLIAEGGIYLVTLLEKNADGNHVRSYFNPAVKREMVDLLGDFWDARQLTDDFDFVCMVFGEFFKTGDVSHQWLS